MILHGSHLDTNLVCNKRDENNNGNLQKKKQKEPLKRSFRADLFSLMIAKPKHGKACIAGHYHGFIAWRFYPRTGPGNVEPLADSNFRFATLQCIQGIPRGKDLGRYMREKMTKVHPCKPRCAIHAAWIPSEPTKYSPKWG